MDGVTPTIMISRRVFVRALALALLTLPVAADAQQSTKVSRVGLLGGGSASSNAGRIDAFRRGLRELGYVEERNVVIEQLWAEADLFICQTCTIDIPQWGLLYYRTLQARRDQLSCKRLVLTRWS